MTDVPMVDYMWLVTPASRRLHHASFDDADDITDVEEGDIVCNVTLTCGRRVGWVTLPGVLTRLGEPRCARCCKKTGLPLGDGSPKNNRECRRILGMETP